MDKNFNLGHSFQTRSDRAFNCIYAFLMTRPFTWYHNLWLWPWSLTYFWKTLTLARTFKPEVIELSYCICVFLVTRHFKWYHSFLPCNLDLEVWLVKNFNLGHAFQTRNNRAFILHMCFPCDRTFHMVPLFWPCNLDLEVWSTFEKL